MHEMSLIERVVGTIEESAREQGITKVTKVKLVIGKQKQALPDAMQMAFESFLDQAPFVPESVLEIEEKEIVLRCNECSNEYTPQREYDYRCPSCKSGNAIFIHGREFYIEYYEGD